MAKDKKKKKVDAPIKKSSEKEERKRKIQEYNDKIAKMNGEKTSKEIAKEKKENKITSAFDDGYNFGDVTKTVGKFFEKTVDKAYDMADAWEKDKNKTSDKVKYTAKGLGVGSANFATNLVDAPIQNIQEGAQKGKNKSGFRNYVEGVAKTLDPIGITTLPERIRKTSQIVQNPNKSTWDKILNVGMNVIGDNEITRSLESAGQQMNITNKNAEEDLIKVRKNIRESSNKLNKQYEKEGQQFSEGMRTIGETSQNIGQQVPTALVSILTKNPDIGLTAMGISAKGSSTYEAEQMGADLSTANDMGLTKGLVEVGTEKISGVGSKWLGKGAGDDVLENVIDSKIKNKVGNYLTKKVAGVGSEIVEEGISDIVGTAIDKATVNPDASYSLKDFLHTAKITALSTIGMNALTGSYSKKAYKQNALDMAESQRSENEQKVFESVLEDRIKEATDNGKKKIKGNDIIKITQEVSEDLANGQIDIGSIEKSLGGETYKKYNDLQNKISSLKEEQERLEKLPNSEATLGDSERLKSIKEQISKIDDTSLKQQLSNEVKKLTKNDSLLQKSYEEKDNRSKEFTYEGTDKDTDITKATIESTKGKMNNTKKAHNLVDALIKMGNDRGVAYKVTNNEELKQMGLIEDGQTTNGVYVADNGEILVNLDSKNYLEQILVHETTHTLEETDRYNALKEFAKQFAETNKSYESIKEQIIKDYQNKTKGMSEEEANKYYESEITAKILEDNLDNEDFVKELTYQKPKLVQKLIDTIKYLKKQFSTSSAEARKLNKLQYQMEQAYKKAYTEKTSLNKGNVKFSIKTDKFNNKYVDIDVDQKQFDNLSLEKQRKLAKDILNDKYNGFINDEVHLSKRAIKEYTNPQEKISNTKKRTKYRLSTELNNLYEVSKKINDDLIPNDNDHKYHEFAKDGWNYYYAKFKFGNNEFIGKINEGISNSKPSFYNVTDIFTPDEYKKMTENGTLSKNESALIQSFLKNNISQSNNNVKSDISTKYSIQENKNNTQELDNSSFSLKQKQLDIINNTNPSPDNYHTWIRSTDDIKTFEEAFFEDGEYSGMDPDFTEEMARHSLNKGKITIYSSYPIENGVFVSPSKMEASQYSGGDESKLYSKEVNINDVAWIDGAEGQYAKVENVKNSLSSEDIAPIKRKGTLGSEVKLDNKIKNKTDLAPIKSEVRFSLNESEKVELDGLKALDESGLANDKEIERLNELEKRSKEKSRDKKAIRDYVESKLEKAIRKQAYKNINVATKTAQNYLNFNNEQKSSFKDSLIDLSMKTREELVNSDSYEEVKNIVSNYANVEYNYVDEELKSIKKVIKDSKINIPDEVKNQITDYSDFAKSSKLNISKNGQNIDNVWQELSESYPYIFSSDIQTEADMLYALSDIMNKDIKTTEKYRIPDKDLKIATDKIYNKLIYNSLTQADILNLQKDLEVKAEERTRQVVQNELLEKMGLSIEDLSVGNDINSIAFQRTDPKRLNEKIFGQEIGQKVNDATVNFVSSQEAKNNRWKNAEREEIKSLGIKARSKESAAVQKYGEKQYITDKGEVKYYGDVELRNEFKDKATREKIIHASEVLKEKYNNYIDKINESIVDMGYNPIPKRKDYFRHFYEISDKLSDWGIPFNKNEMNSDVLPTDINGLTDEFKPGKNWFASALERKGIRTTYDAITGIDGYLENAGNLIFHTESIQRYRSLSKFIRDNYGAQNGLDNVEGLSDAQIQQRISDIQNNKLSKYVAWLDEQANALAGKKGAIDRSMERFFGRKVYKALNTLKSQVGSNMTGFNIRSSLTNFASALQGASKTNKLSFIKGTLSTLNNIVHDDGLINKSNFLTNRFGSDSLSKKMWQKISNAGQIFMNGSDYFTSNQIWRSKYYENLSKGMSENQAIKNADDFSSRIMGDRSKGQTAEIFNSKTLGFLTQFQLEVNNQWSSMIHDNKMDLKSGNKSGAMVVFQLGQLFGASYLFNNLMKSLTGSDVMFDPIDILKDIIKPKDDDKTLEERAREGIGKVIDQLPMASIFTGGRIPISEAFKGGSTAFKYASGRENEYGQKYTLNDVKDDFLESVAYWLLPTGYGQIRKTTKGLSMYDKDLDVKGSYTDSGNLRFTADDTIGEKIKASLFGQYATKHSQDYIDSGYKSIDKSKLDELKDLKMNSTEYRKYRQGLTDAGTKKEEKLNYIKDLDVSNKKKNIMASNLMKKDFNVKEYSKFDSLEEYNYFKKNPSKYQTITAITDYKNYKDISKYIKDIKADVDRNGNVISNSRFKKVAQYVNSLNLTAVQKAMILKEEFPSFKQYDNKIAQYINKQNYSFLEKSTILKGLGFKNYDKQIISYIQEHYKTIDEQIEMLEKLGFKTYEYNGRTYVKR